MPPEVVTLTLTATSIGFIHTLLGPDHYIPFAAMAHAGRWPLRKTMSITLVCGIGHVASSVAIGLLGLALGAAVMRLTVLERIRGDVAAWLLLGFGLVYMSWGIVRAVRRVPHSHGHGTHSHRHADPPQGTMTPWVLFIVFVLGPCEPLIPLIMYPAARSHGTTAILVVTLGFALATLVTMLAVVALVTSGLSSVPLRRMERYGHALAGLAIAACGVAVLCGL